MLKNILRLIFITLLVLVLSEPVIVANVRLPRIFNSDMILQQGQRNPVWGWADEDEEITLIIGRYTVRAKAGKDKKWVIEIPSMDYGGPYILTIKGNNTIQLENILIGEVWVCSGQSNMEMLLESSLNAENEIALANYPGIRIFSVSRAFAQYPEEDLLKGKWELCSSENVAKFSAVGYFFGRYLHQKLNVPIGLINASYGGTKIKCWMSENAISKQSELAISLQEMKEQVLFDVNYKSMAEMPSILFNAMINPIIPFGIKGVIWYQGESDRGSPEQYKELFPAMINDWRDHWGEGDFPFLFVSLANYRKPNLVPGKSNWAEIREAQTEALFLPNTGMALAIDIGEEDNIHPKNKQEVGRRLVRNALKVAYEKDILSMGPRFHSMEIKGNSIIITFNYTGKGLFVKNQYGYINGFAIAEADHQFYWAKAELIDEKTVKIYSAEVHIPVAVRYGWADNPHDLNLYNSAGLPATPFRTDR